MYIKENRYEIVINNKGFKRLIMDYFAGLRVCDFVVNAI